MDPEFWLLLLCVASQGVMVYTRINPMLENYAPDWIRFLLIRENVLHWVIVIASLVVSIFGFIELTMRMDARIPFADDENHDHEHEGDVPVWADDNGSGGGRRAERPSSNRNGASNGVSGVKRRNVPVVRGRPSPAPPARAPASAVAGGDEPLQSGCSMARVIQRIAQILVRSRLAVNSPVPIHH